MSKIAWNTSIHIVSLSALTPNQEEWKSMIFDTTSPTLDCVLQSTTEQSSSTQDRVQNILYYTTVLLLVILYYTTVLLLVILYYNTVLLLVYNTFSSIPRTKSSIHDLVEVSPATLRRVILIIERPMVTFLFFIVLTCRDD